MDSNCRRVALCVAVDTVAREGFYLCEPLERRVLLSNDPVIVLTEPFSLDTWPTVTSQSVDPWLWKNPEEFQWDLDQ